VVDEYDAVIHVDETRAVEPLERTARWEEGQVWKPTRSRCEPNPAVAAEIRIGARES